METEKLINLYYEMLRIRMVEESIAELYLEQEMRCPVHLCVGQEAIPVGVCAHLKPDDYVLSSHRSHGHYLAKGGDLKSMVAEIYGKKTGCAMGKGGSMHLIDLEVGFLGATPIVGSTIPIAVGASFGASMVEEKKVSVSFFGDGAMEEGVFYESVNFAVLKNLPVVFVCENNFYSVNSPLSVRQPKGREVYTVARGIGIDSYQGDGNDVMEVYSMAGEAVHRACSGGGPTFLEFKTYRWREHCGPLYDHKIGIRPADEFESWKKRCPIERFEKRLLRDGKITETEIARMKTCIRVEIEDAVNFAQAAPFPEEELLLEHIYA